uniref:Uncharacterized protein n=1 Tax=Arundo donax TaxID=35708 RepID=A0A0A8XNI5_ARUDO
MVVMQVVSEICQATMHLHLEDLILLGATTWENWVLAGIFLRSVLTH